MDAQSDEPHLNTGQDSRSPQTDGSGADDGAEVNTAAPAAAIGSAAISSMPADTASGQTAVNGRPRPPKVPVRCLSAQIIRAPPTQASAPPDMAPALPEISIPPPVNMDMDQAVVQPPEPIVTSPAVERQSQRQASVQSAQSARLSQRAPASAVAASSNWGPPQAVRPRGRSNTVSVSFPASNWERRTGRKLPDIEADPGRSPLRGASMEHPGRRSSGDLHRNSITVSLSEHSDHDHRPDSPVVDHYGHLHDDMVSMLDCVDEEVGTVTHLQNMTNGIMFPNIPALWNRCPNVTLGRTRSDSDSASTASLYDEPLGDAPPRQGRSRAGTITKYLTGKKGEERLPTSAYQTVEGTETPPMPLKPLQQGDFDEQLSQETEQVKEEHELDKHMKRVLRRRARKEKLKPILKGLWTFLKTPMGIITAIYGFLVVFWGAAIVLFLLGWIPTNSKNTQDIWVEISSQVVNGLFTVTGVGLIPWRAIDTYRMSIIHTLKMKTRRLRKKQGLPPIEDEDDLPDPLTIPGYKPVLSEKDQNQLRYQQEKFSQSQTWYRPHATATHRAFPITLALWNTILMDGNSFFQCILCGCMWGMNRHQRPAWTTGTLIPCSFLCGIGAAVLTWWGGKKTKKTDAVEKKLRAALGVDEKVDDRVKKPRRATVSGGEAPSNLVHEANSLQTRRPSAPPAAGRSTVRRSTVDIPPTVPDDVPPVNRAELLGVVEESEAEGGRHDERSTDSSSDEVKKDPAGKYFEVAPRL